MGRGGGSYSLCLSGEIDWLLFHRYVSVSTARDNMLAAQSLWWCILTGLVSAAGGFHVCLLLVWGGI